jgi:hypothetical protein
MKLRKFKVFENKVLIYINYLISVKNITFNTLENLDLSRQLNAIKPYQVIRHASKNGVTV